jgi:hypothetical protein
MRHRTAAAIAAAFAAVLIAPAAAQFGSIFGDAPPRPPAAVPGARQQPMPEPPNDPPSYPPQSRYPSQSPYPAQSGYPPAGAGGGAAAVETRPLPAPGAVSLEPPPGERPQLPRAAPLPAAPQVGDAPPGADEVVTEPPSQKIVNSAALFSGLDKISGRIINFDVAIGETVQFGALQLTPRACYTRPATETANTDAFIEVDEVTLQGEVRRIFTGWVFAASPGLHAIEHPIYDIWLTDCKNPVEIAEKQPDPPAAPAPRTPQRPQQAKQQPQRSPSARPQALPPPR